MYKTNTLLFYFVSLKIIKLGCSSTLSNFVKRIMLTAIINHVKLFASVVDDCPPRQKCIDQQSCAFARLFTMHFCRKTLVQCIEERRAITMKLLGILLIIIVSFLGLGFLVHICSKNNYAIEFSSKKRKIRIYPAKQNRFNHSFNKEHS